MTELYVEELNETVIEIEGGPTLSTTVDETVQTIVQEFIDPVLIDLNSGPRGEPGAAILTGFHPPDTAVGVMGDMYIVTQGSVLVGQVFKKTSPATWTDVGNVRGPAGGVNTVNGYTGPDVTLDKADIGLEFADNTSDADKPISTANQAALDTTVKLTGAQTIAGIKTFSSAPVVPIDSFAIDRIAGLVAALASKPDTTTVVLLTGAQTIAGVKTFSSAPVVPDAAFAITKIGGLQAALDLKAPLASPTFTGIITGNGSGLTALNGSNISTGTVADARLSANVNLLDVAQSVTAIKTFTVSPIVPTPTTATQVANKGYVDTTINAIVDAAPGTLDTLNELAAALGDDPNFAATITNNLATKVSLTGDETIAGTKTFSSEIVGPSSGNVLKVGDDARIADIGVAHTVGIVSQTTPNNGGIQFGSTAGNARIIGVGTALTIYATQVTFDGFISGNGANITQLNASSIASGTLNNSRLPTRLQETGSSGVTDWNNVVQNGWHHGSNATNAPTTGWFMGIVTVHDQNPASRYVTQKVWDFTGTSDTDAKCYERRSTGASVWTAWRRVRYLEGELDARYMTLSTTQIITGLKRFTSASPSTGSAGASLEIRNTDANGHPSIYFHAPGIRDSILRLNSVSGRLEYLKSDGTVLDAAGIGAALFTGSGAGLTDLNGTAITTGTIAAARLPATMVHRVVHNGTSWPARPTGATYVEWVGPTAPGSATSNDTWVNTSV